MCGPFTVNVYLSGGDAASRFQDKETNEGDAVTESADRIAEWVIRVPLVAWNPVHTHQHSSPEKPL